MARANGREHGNERVDACEEEWVTESAWEQQKQAPVSEPEEE